MKLLLLSNSTNQGEKFLEYPATEIADFLGNKIRNAVFIPYAAVTFSFDEYEFKVKERFNDFGYEVHSVHRFKDPAEAIINAEAILIGGGNTFHLLKNLQEQNILHIIRDEVKMGKPYIGWSAGSNVSCPTICTTNDMPIVETKGFNALNLLPFQINPHYTDFVPPGFGGETRDQRIAEFLAANPLKTVVGLREGTLLKLMDNNLSLMGPHSARIFRFNQPWIELNQIDDLNFLLQ